MLRGGEHLLRLIDDVLDLSRIEAGGIAISPEPVDVGEVLAEVITTLEPMAARMQIQLVTPASQAELPRVVADRTRLAQILMNFGSNAIKYGKPKGHVSFRVEPGPTRLRITVLDDGIGIPEDKRDKIFEPFQRAGQEAGPIEGTGIGLAISKRLAELMRGTVGFKSLVGAGSEFWVELPVHLVAAGEPAPVRLARPEASPLADGQLARYTVVYVEDNPSNIAFMRDLMGELPERRAVDRTDRGDRARADPRPDAEARDHGHQPARHERARRGQAAPRVARDQHIPVIALSAAALVRDTTRAKEAGFYRYLTKPVKVAELTQVLEELLR